MRRLAAGSALALSLALLGVAQEAVRKATQQTPPGFRDITATAGITFRHTGGNSAMKYLPETLGSGVAVLDVDGDGWQDLFFVNGKGWAPGTAATTGALYRNLGNGKFADASRSSGLDVSIHGMGAAAADYDNDGQIDLYVTAVGGDHLFHNEGGGRFRDVTRTSGIANDHFGTSSAWVDYDRDGNVDLFVANYVEWNSSANVRCSLDGRTRSYCTPESYKGVASRLFRNLGNGKFEDTGLKAGIGDSKSKSLGVAVLDYNRDGWPDLFVANDTQPNKLYRNRRDGTFAEEGLAAGVAFGEDGVARGAMGADAADYDGAFDRSEAPHLLVGNFSNQMLGLYHNDGKGLFIDEAPRSEVGRASLLTLTFGAFFFDFDLDGKLDIFAANGHIDDAINRVQPRVQYRQAPLLFLNQGQGRFGNASASAGADFARVLVARGAAYADFDHDGDLDVVLTENNGPARLYRNEGGNRNNWLTVRLAGTKSNRSAIGATVRIEAPTGSQWAMVKSGSSYCSQSDLALTFGLGKDAAVTALDIEWPSGAKQRITNLSANRHVVIEEKP